MHSVFFEINSFTDVHILKSPGRLAHGFLFLYLISKEKPYTHG